MDQYRTWLEISAAAFAHNVASVRTLVEYNTHIGLVLKANAYGHGIALVGMLAEVHKDISWLMVSDIEEALLLRATGCLKNILTLSGTNGAVAEAIENNVVFSISDYSSLHHVAEVASSWGKVARVHIKVDSGMHRLGFAYQELEHLFSQLKTYACLRVEGMFAHLPITSEPDGKCMDQQIAAFYEVCQKFDPAHALLRHIIASGSLDRCSGEDMVRVGTMAYGSWKSRTHIDRIHVQSPQIQVVPILQWKSRIMQCKNVSAGEYIGYDRTFRAGRDMRTGVIPVGYADGYQRGLSNSGSVLVGSSYAPIVGLISMNLTIIDITDIPNATVGSEVVLVGPYERIRPSDIASVLESNPNVITASISASIPRLLVE